MEEEATMDEDQELIEIERLSDELETLYKKLEHLRRENVLFETYKTKIENKMREEGKHVPVDPPKLTGNDDKYKLTIDEKFEIASTEAENLKKKVEEGKSKADTMIETLRTVLDETDLAILEIKKDAFDFQREILIGGENSRTGKIEADRIIKYRQEKMKQKDAMKKKYETKKDTLNHQIAKLVAQIRKKDELGDDLKFIDFHQLQIENKKYVKEIEDKNNKLLKMKMSTGKIVKTWNETKRRLNKELGKNVNNKKNIKNMEILIAEQGGKLKELTEITAKELEEIGKLEEDQKKVSKEGSMNIQNFIQDKQNERQLIKAIKDYERKIEILSLKFKYAMKEINTKHFNLSEGEDDERLEDVSEEEDDPQENGDNDNFLN